MTKAFLFSLSQNRTQLKAHFTITVEERITVRWCSDPSCAHAPRGLCCVTTVWPDLKSQREVPATGFDIPAGHSALIKSVRRGLRQARESRDSVTQHDNISRNSRHILSCPQGGHLAQLLGTVCLPRLHLDTGSAGGLPASALRQESVSFFGWH